MTQVIDDTLLQVRFLDPKRLHFWRTPGGVLRMTLEDEWSCLKVVVARAFPLSHPDEYVSLRDEDKKELGMLRRLRDLPGEARRLVEEELYRRYFLPQVERITSIRERFGVAEWEVLTTRGPHQFLTRSVRDSVAELDPHHFIVTDVDGNRYEIPNLAALDARSVSTLTGLM
jgi:hypothetical protein